MKIRFIFLSILLSSVLSSSFAQVNIIDSVRHQLQWRTYKVHLPPAYDGSVSMPLVIALHGGGHVADTMEYISDFSQKADESNFIVVYPNGRKFFIQTWNAGTCCGNSVTYGVDDVGFIVKMIDSLKANYNIDASRIFVTGASNGGMLAYRLACEKSEIFAAIAPVATTMVVTNPCTPIREVPVLHIHSLIDENVPYDGGYGTGFAGIYMPPVDSVTEVWSINNDCIGALDTIYNTRGTIGKGWSDCSSCSEVLIYTTTDGGHSWPGGNQTNNGDPISNQLNATELIWNFFSQHSLDCTTTSIKETTEIINELSIYPNPTNGMININVDNEKLICVKVFNTAGMFLDKFQSPKFQ